MPRASPTRCPQTAPSDPDSFCVLFSSAVDYFGGCCGTHKCLSDLVVGSQLGEPLARVAVQAQLVLTLQDTWLHWS